MNKRKIFTTTSIIIIFSLISKVLGLFRETLVASTFGSNFETDAFFVALSVMGLVTTLLTEAISTTFIPILSEIEVKEGKDGKIYHTNNLLIITSLLSIILMLFVWLLSPLVTSIIARGFDSVQFNLTVILIKLGLPMIILSSIMGVLRAYLETEEKFYSSSAKGIPLNFAYIIFLLFWSQLFGIKGLMTTAVVGAFLQLIIQIPELKKTNFKFKFNLKFSDPYMKKVIYLSIPVLLGVAANDIGVIVDKTLASNLLEGSITALSYSERLTTIIHGVFVTAVTTVIFPLLAIESSKKNIKNVKKILSKGINFILLITIPATVGMIVFAFPIVNIVFERGAFTSHDTFMTSQALICYSIGLVALSLRILITKVYYSIQDTKTPFINSILGVIIDIVLNVVLINSMGHAGLALSTSIGSTVATGILLISLRKKIGTLEMKKNILCGVKSLLASLFMAGTGYLIYFKFHENFSVSTINHLAFFSFIIILCISVYIIMSLLFKIEEVVEIKNNIVIKLKKKPNNQK